METLQFRPEVFAWWSLLAACPGRLTAVHRWIPREHGLDDPGPGTEQHPTATLVVCLAGATRIEHGRQRLDLQPGQACVVLAGAWHRHARPRPGSILFRQGFIAGRSDFFLEDHRIRFVAAWPEQPSRRLMERIAAESGAEERVRLLAQLIRQAAAQAVAPLPAGHQAALPMEYALYEHLHRPDAVGRIIAASGLGRARAYRVFQERWGAGLASIVRRERMALGRELLASGLSVQETALRCGIRSAPVFSRIYRRHWGHAPSLDRS